MLCIAERDVCVIGIFKKSGGWPGPSDATPMFLPCVRIDAHNRQKKIEAIKKMLKIRRVHKIMKQLTAKKMVIS